MNLSLAAIEAASKECVLHAAASDINLVPPAGYEVRFPGEVVVKLTTRRVGEEFFVGGEVKTPAVFTCVRCLKEYEADQAASLELIIHRVAVPRPMGPELESYIELTPGTAEFDLAPYVREALLLGVPLTPHCKSDCRGLCAHCGADLNLETCRCPAPAADSRWDGLRQLSSVKR
jgi:uncharacterized protein